MASVQYVAYHRLSPQAAIAWLVLIAVAGYAVVVPWALDIDPVLTDFSRAGLAPGTGGLFGTDSAGHDVFFQVAAGLQISLAIALIAAISSAVLGALLGILAGMTGGWTDRIIMRSVDGLNALPHMLLGVLIVSLYRGSIWAIIAALVMTHWTPVARIVRAQILSLRHAEYIEAAWLAGMSRWNIIRYHMVPAALGQSMVAFILLIPHAIWHESTLSFLGLGLPPHKPSLGTLLADAQGALLLGHWWILVFPGLFLVATTLSVAVIGSNLRSLLTGIQETW